MRHLVLIIPIVMLVGCSSAISPAIQEYTIYPASDQAAPTVAHSSKILRLSTTKPLPSLASRNLYYLKDGGESGSYLYTRWSDTPAILIERSLSSALHEQGLFTSLLTPTSAAQADWVLESDLNAFYHRFETGQKSAGVIDITYRLIDTKTKLLISSKRFRIATAAASEDAKGGIDALTLATRELTEQSTRWLSIQVQEKK
ncbi:ABC-type transport auxiliary lipoprotein family protein [Sulfuricurvum sp.]|uniref:ABC-type transport auxiliary lipoprotein family protein n=1 Tax=Sulfuricurvum sp. TaxID=2025608 RepID=UPI003C5E8FE8